MASDAALVQLEAERDRLQRLTRKGIGMPAAGILYWLAVAGVVRLWPQRTALVISFVLTGAVFPVGALLTRLVGGNLFAKSPTLSPLSLLLAAVQFFYWPVIVLIFRHAPDWTPFAMAVLFGSHFLPYAWLYRSRAYAVLAIATSVILTVAVVVTRSPLYDIAPLLAAACYAVAVAMLWRELTAPEGQADQRQRQQPEETWQSARVDWPARRAAIVALAIMLAYFAIDNHVPLYPWNNLVSAGPQWPSTLAGWVPGVFTMWALACGSRWGITFGAGWTVIWLLLQVRQWWLPYLFGPTPLHQDFGWYWEGGYAQTLHILPARALRPVPDVEHLVLQLLSLAAAFFTVRAARHAWMQAKGAGIARPRGDSLGH